MHKVAPTACSQFVFWGELVDPRELPGEQPVAARNMDGECDVRKVTVTHFLLRAVEEAESPGPPGERDGRRYVSALWPGGMCGAP